MLPGKKYKPEDILEIAWRRKWVVVLPFILLVPVVLVFSRALPDRYRSEAVIMVQPQRVPESYVRSTVTTRIEDRLRSMQADILSRTRLLPIIEEFKLYPEAMKAGLIEDAVERMRTRDIRIDILRGDVFKVSYTAGDPRTAQVVAARLSNLFIDTTITDRLTLADSTTSFLATQLDSARKELEEKEGKLSDFKRQYAGELPTERQSNLQVLQNLQTQVQTLVESINRDRDRSVLLERQLADVLAESQAASAGSVVIASPDDPAAIAGGSAAARLEAARQNLRALETRLKPEHPDVQRMKRAIKDLEAEAQAEALRKPLSPEAAPAVPSTPQEVARVKRVKELQADIASLDLQIKGKLAEEQRLRGQIAVHEARLGAIPVREAELAKLMRDYDTMLAAYQSLLAKQVDSKMAANLETAQQSEKFKVVDEARLPERPFSPNRQLIDLAGLLGALGFGVGLAALLEYRDKSFRSEDDIVTTLSLPVLALVPVMTTTSERRRRKRTRILMSFAAVSFLAVMVTGAVAYKLGWLAPIVDRFGR